jgi:hypothetical protein
VRQRGNLFLADALVGWRESTRNTHFLGECIRSEIIIETVPNEEWRSNRRDTFSATEDATQPYATRNGSVMNIACSVGLVREIVC